MTLPLLTERPSLRARRRALGLHILHRGLIEPAIPPNEIKPQHRGQHDTRHRERHIRHIGLPVPGALALRVEVRRVDRRQVGPRVDDRVRDGALGGRAGQGGGYPLQHWESVITSLCIS